MTFMQDDEQRRTQSWKSLSRAEAKVERMLQDVEQEMKDVVGDTRPVRQRGSLLHNRGIHSHVGALRQEAGLDDLGGSFQKGLADVFQVPHEVKNLFG